MLKFLKSWQFMVGFFVALCVAAVGLTWWGVTHDDESGLMPDAYRWEHMPLVVWGQAGDIDHPDSGINNAEIVALHYAVDTTNRRLGFTALSYDDHNFRGWPDIVVEFRVPVGADGCKDAGGDFSFKPQLKDATILVCNTGTSEVTQLVLQHELGHALGLAHDPGDETSIMRPVQTETPMGEFPARIDDHDRALLRRLYGPR